MDRFCDCREPRVITKPSGRVVCEACGQVWMPIPATVVRP